MKATINKVLKELDETLCVAEVSINQDGIQCTLNVSSNENVNSIGKTVDIDLCLYSDEYKTYSHNLDYTECFERIRSDAEYDTYCKVVGKVEEVSKLEEELHVYVKCLGNELHIVCYNFEDNPVIAGDTISAKCWVEMIE